MLVQYETIESRTKEVDIVKKRWLKMNASLPCFMFLQVLMSKCASTPYQRNLKVCVKIEII